MAVARPAPTPNPDAMKFTLDITLPERILANHGDAVDDEFTTALLATDGVASVFGVNDFVTITRVNGADWDPIVCAVEEAAVAHLPACADDDQSRTAAVARARALLRDAAQAPGEHRGRDPPQLWSRSRQLTGAALRGEDEHGVVIRSEEHAVERAELGRATVGTRDDEHLRTEITRRLCSLREDVVTAADHQARVAIRHQLRRRE